MSLGSNVYITCNKLDIDGDDRITMMQVRAGADGILGFDLQTSKRPIISVGGSTTETSFKASNWVDFIEGTDFAGFWGEMKADGYLGGLGYIVRDSVCT